MRFVPKPPSVPRQVFPGDILLDEEGEAIEPPPPEPAPVIPQKPKRIEHRKKKLCTFQLSKEEQADFKSAAKHAKMSLSAWIRFMCRQASGMDR